MPTVHVKFKHKSIDAPSTYGYASGSDSSVPVSSKNPTESEVLAALKKRHPNKDLVIIEIK